MVDERTPGRQYLSGFAASSGAGISNRKGTEANVNVLSCVPSSVKVNTPHPPNILFIILKYILTGNILSPFSTKIPLNNPRPLHKLICTEQKIHPHNRQLQYKRGEESKGHCIYPHIDRITDQAKLRITACTEYTIKVVFTAVPIT